MDWFISLRRSLFSSLLFLLFVNAAAAGNVNYAGTGGDLNVATFDSNSPTGVDVGITTYTISVSDTYVVGPGDAITVILAGLEYPYASDLEASLTYDGVTEDLFNQIGGPGADPAQFGNSGSSIDSGNYIFNSSFPGDLWATAAPLGSTDSIPDGDYFTTDINDHNDQLSSAFDGLSVNGTWTLTITDYCPPFSDCVSVQNPFLYNPGITSWGLSIETALPEPSTAIPTALSAGLLWWRMRRGGSDRGRR
jgi:hypothetical protein